MRYSPCIATGLLLFGMIAGAATLAVAQDESSTEITGFYQQYKDFSFKTGNGSVEIPPTRLNGGGFGIAQNLAPWFSVWTQFSFFGSAGESSGLNVRLIHNLQGVRWQTPGSGPFRLYVKGGMGFANYRFDFGSNTKLTVAYGGGLQIWPAKHVGVALDLSHVFMGVPDLTGLDGRDKWDSGITFTPGLTIRF